MTHEQVYAALLALYPRAFREEYGEAMLDAFRDMKRHGRHRPLALWRFVAADLCSSACREQLDACRHGTRRFVLGWLGVCAAGALATGLVANGLTWSFAYFYHPFLEGLTFPPWIYGAFLGLGLGAAQSLALRQPLRVGAGWVVVSAASTALGLHVVTRTASPIGPIGDGAVLGGFIGGCQWMLARASGGRGGRGSLAGAVALPLAVVACEGLIQRALGGMNPMAIDLAGQPHYRDALEVVVRAFSRPSSWSDLAVEFAVMTVSGLVVGAVTARPIAEARHAH